MPRPLGYDPDAAATRLAAADRTLGRLIARVGPARLRRHLAGPPFRALARSVAHQQLTGKVANAILGRFEALYGGRFPDPEELAATGDDELRAVGFSRAKIAALRDLAAKTLDGTVPPARTLARLADDQVVERLIVVRGIGRWTAEMLLIFGLGRPDVLPATDFGVRKGFGLVFRRGEPADPGEVLERGERWRPWRSVASWYLWRAAESPQPR